jgi:hypothetical protein
MKNEKPNCTNGKFKRKDREHKNTKKIGANSQNGPIAVATKIEAFG